MEKEEIKKKKEICGGCNKLFEKGNVRIDIADLNIFLGQEGSTWKGRITVVLDDVCSLDCLLNMIQEKIKQSFVEKATVEEVKST